MSVFLALVARYQLWLYCLLAILGLIYVRSLWKAHRYLKGTPFGLEREAAYHHQNMALVMLLIVGVLALSIFIINAMIVPNAATIFATPTPSPLPTRPPTPTAIPTLVPNASPPPLVVDSSGCLNSRATLTTPQSGERLTGSYEVRGTAAIDNFGFYKFEISGYATGGEWRPVYVGRVPVVAGLLGIFDAATYPAGEYAFRLVVTDNAGNYPPPCVVAITIAAAAAP